MLLIKVKENEKIINKFNIKLKNLLIKNMYQILTLEKNNRNPVILLK